MVRKCMPTPSTDLSFNHFTHWFSLKYLYVKHPFSSQQDNLVDRIISVSRCVRAILVILRKHGIACYVTDVMKRTKCYVLTERFYGARCVFGPRRYRALRSNKISFLIFAEQILITIIHNAVRNIYV